MHKQKPPARDSRFVSLRIASEELGLPYHLLYTAAKNGQVATLSLADDSKAKSRPVIYVSRESLDAFIAARLRKEAA